MACYLCPEGYWVCNGPDSCEEFDIKAFARSDCVDVAQRGTYYVLCKPGCEAKLSLQPDTKPPWSNLGYIDLEAGSYQLRCSMNRGECQVAVHPVEDCPD